MYMKTSIRFLFFAICICISFSTKAADTVSIHETQIPILIERHDNVLFYLRLTAKTTHVLNDVVITFGNATKLKEINSVKLYYSGTEAYQSYNKSRFAPVDYLSFTEPNNTLAANLSYSILRAVITSPTQRTIILKGNQTLFPGVNYFWVSLQMQPDASLSSKVTAQINSVTLDGEKANIDIVSPKNIEHRMGKGLRHAGDNDAKVYRIPGLTTSNTGALLAVYDIRYNNGNDLQEYINIGFSKSNNKGNTWGKMRIPLAFGENGGLPSAQNGVGDPCILYDTKTNTIWIAAVWMHGMGHQVSWFSSQQGMDPNLTGQLVLTKSTDEGKTWSEPVSVVPQFKNSSWRLLLQGPGKGITMQDGTLVFPIQFIDSASLPHSAIMYSKDHGEHWSFHQPARDNTTEAQVAEIEPGVLMLNMRDNRGGSRAVAITKDLGKTWIEHPSSRKALPESVCMASLLHVPANENIYNKDILLFSNPSTTKGRHHITIKASFDEGITWPIENQLLLDEGNGWGYSCLTMIDKETIGILYESSVAEITFQTIKLKDVINKTY